MIKLAFLAAIVFGIMAIASLMDAGDAIRAKAYYCGYARGMKFVADLSHYDVGPVPLKGCEQFDALDRATQ